MCQDEFPVKRSDALVKNEKRKMENGKWKMKMENGKWKMRANF
jgi:hypothetical protein